MANGNGHINESKYPHFVISALTQKQSIKSKDILNYQPTKLNTNCLTLSSVYTCIHTYAHSYIHTNKQTYIYIYICMYVCMYNKHGNAVLISLHYY